MIEVAARMRELGMYLEGLARTVAPPFRLRKIHPTLAETGMTNVRLDVWCEGSWDDSAKIYFDGVEQTSTTVLDFSHAWCTLAALGPDAKAVKVQVRQGTAPAVVWQSNEILFAIVGSTVPLAPRRAPYKDRR